MRTILITKEILCKEYISYYGNAIHTPNIDYLFKNGSVINDYIVSAPLTTMALPIMFTGMNAFQIEMCEEKETAMDVLKKAGKKCSAIITKQLKNFMADCEYINRGFNINYVDNEWRCKGGIKPYMDLIEKDKSDFLWVHLNHFFYPEACIRQELFTQEESDKYNDLGVMSQTMLAVDKFIGWLINSFPNDKIIFTGDHGEAQGQNGHWWYTNYFDHAIVNVPFVVYQSISQEEFCDVTISSKSIKNVILNKPIKLTDTVVSETRFSEQKDKKLMLLKDEWKYLYNDETKNEKLYYLKLNESFNFIDGIEDKEYYDNYKKFNFKYRKLVNYEDWEKASNILNNFRKQKEMWTNKKFNELEKSL